MNPFVKNILMQYLLKYIDLHHIVWNNFSSILLIHKETVMIELEQGFWINPLIGGIIVGFAASLLLLFQGKIFGVTGIVSGAMFSKGSDQKWRIAATLGLMSGAAIVHVVNPAYFNYEFKGSIWMMVLAGLFVGFGTRLGSGCTSGHGICGLPRFSMRSLIAVCTFMVTGGITVYLFRHVLNLN